VGLARWLQVEAAQAKASDLALEPAHLPWAGLRWPCWMLLNDLCWRVGASVRHEVAS
jgi:hypothetical protein